MDTKSIIFLLGIVSVLSGCKSDKKAVISAVCQREAIGNYFIKWETNPQMTSPMKLYVSDDPETFNLAESVHYTKIDNGAVKYITNDNIVRKYFMISFDNQYFKIIGSRIIPTQSIMNLRDIGGYANDTQQEIRWGKVYRSGDLTRISKHDSLRLKDLKIKTIVDLRPQELTDRKPIPFNEARLINIPITTLNERQINRKLEKGTIKKGDGMLFMEDTYLRFVNDYSKEFGQVLKLFTDKENYPILVSSGLGKDKIGYFTAILMSVLGIPRDAIKKDYMLSNNHIDINQFSYARKFNTDAQETITLMLGAHESCINLAFKQINKKYGSVEKYLKEGLQLTTDDINNIREILLR